MEISQHSYEQMQIQIKQLTEKVDSMTEMLRNCDLELKNRETIISRLTRELEEKTLMEITSSDEEQQYTPCQLQKQEKQKRKAGDLQGPLATKKEKKGKPTEAEKPNTNKQDPEIALSQASTTSTQTSQAFPISQQTPPEIQAEEQIMLSSQEEENSPPLNMPANTDNTSNPERKNKNNRVPPIILRDKTKWELIKTFCGTNHIKISHAVNINEGIRFHLTTSDAFRKVKKALDDHKIPSHTYHLPEEKTLHVVFRGVAEHIQPADIAEELKFLGYTPIKVSRMRRQDKSPMPLVTVELPRDEHHKKIYQLTSCQDLRIKVQALEARTKFAQCHNCQLFGHSQKFCTAPPRCHRCGKDHHFSQCKKPVTKEACCCNCGGPHPANYSGCPKHPRNLEISRQQRRESTIPPPNPSAWKDPKITTALFQKHETHSNTSPGNHSRQSPKNSPAQNVQTDPTQQMLQAMMAMQNFMAQFQNSFQQSISPLIQALSNSNAQK